MKNNRRNHNNDDWHNKVGLKVIVQHNDVAKALRKLKKKIAEDGLLQELRKREYYESKGTKKRLAKKAAIRRYKRNQAKLREQLGY
jgi:ribosomal protein S21|tara:strand:- start:808 stop:1065 length:258 start_codon:yes stop_codon:yes gene_type:complete